MNTHNPFVGLRPFESSDSLFYFGREAETKLLLQKLYLNHFVAVIGSSGSGKSSLIRAGVIPRLLGGFLAQDRDTWRIAKLKPGNTPLKNLAKSLIQAYKGTSAISAQDKIEKLATEMSNVGVSAVEQFLSPLLDKSDINLFILVDQFEELFRFGTGNHKAIRRQEAEEFVDLLLTLKDSDLPIYLCLTMRSDFIGDCDAFHGFPEAISNSQFLVPRLTRQKRKEVITHPIALNQAHVTPRLVDRLLNEDINTRDDLPVLQHALMRTWEAWSLGNTDTPLDIKHYEKVQTIHNALNAHAKEVWSELSPPQRKITVRMFKLLTAIDANNRRIRHPAHLKTIAEITDATQEAVHAVIEKFRSNGRAFLTLSTQTSGESTLVDISHESLIRQWTTLAKWVDEESELAKAYERLTESALQHQNNEGDLYTGADLLRVRNWHEKIPKGNAGKVWSQRYNQNFEAAIKFLEDSIKAEEVTTILQQPDEEKLLLKQQLSETEDLNNEQKKSLNFLCKASITVGVISSFICAVTLFTSEISGFKITSLTITLVAAIFLARAAYNKQTTQISREESKNKKFRSRLVELTAEKESSDKKLGSLATYEANAKQKSTEAEQLKREAEISLEDATELKKKAKQALKKAKQIESEAGTLFSLALKDKAELAIEKAQLFPHKSTSHRLALRHALLYVLEVLSKSSEQAKPSDHTLSYLYSINPDDLIESHENLLASNYKSAITAVAYSPNKSCIALNADESCILIKCTSTGKVLNTLEFHTKQITSLAYDKSGDIIASGSDDNTVCLWSTKTGKLIHSLEGHSAAILKVAFSPDGTSIVSVSSDCTSRIWNVQTGELRYLLNKHTAPVLSLAFHPNGNTLITGSEDKTLCFWSTHNGKMVSQISCQSEIPLSLSYSTNSNQIAYGSHENTIIILDSKHAKIIKRLKGQHGMIREIVYSPNGKELASASSNGSICLWSIETGNNLKTFYGHSGSVNSIAYAPNGGVLISGSSDKTMRLWQLEPSKLIYKLLNDFDPKVTSEALQYLWSLKLDGLNFVDNCPAPPLTQSEATSETPNPSDKKYQQFLSQPTFTETKMMHLLQWLESHSN